MLIPRFWASAEGKATDGEGRKFALRQWGWSQESVSEALALAGRRVTEHASRLSGGAACARHPRQAFRVYRPAPPGQHPRDPVAQQEFGVWLQKYETACRSYATCRFVEAIGSAPPDAEVRGIVDERDRRTRAMEGLSLA